MDIETKRGTYSAFSQNPITICVVSSWFPSWENLFRSLFVLAFAKRIRKIGASVTCITIEKRPDQAFEFIDKIPVYRVSQRHPFFGVFRLLAKIKPDIIHVHAPNFFSSFAIVTAKILRIPVVATVHKVEVQPLGNIVLALIRRIMLLLCDRIVAVSRATRQLTQKCGIDRERISVIYNSAEERTFKLRPREKARSLLQLPLEKDIILFVGRLEPVKGAHFLFNAMPPILRKRNALLLIVGNGSQQSALEGMAKNLNLAKDIFFLSQVPTEKLALYYNAADVFVLPSLVEGHPVVLLEAMASGLPIVATNIGGNNESIVNQVNGFLVRPKNSEELSRAIMTILGDEKLRRRFSKESMKFYQHNFSEKIQLINYFSLYEKLLETREKQTLDCTRRFN